MILDCVEAEDELSYRMKQTRLSPDRYYYLLIQSGVNAEEAENARAKYELEVLKAKSNGKNQQ